MEKKYRVSVKGGFSDRQKIKPFRVEFQITEFDERTRNKMFNMITVLFDEYFSRGIYNDYRVENELKLFINDVYGERVDFRNRIDIDKVLRMIQQTILEDDYDSVLTLIEYICRMIHKENQYESYYRVGSDMVEPFWLFNRLFKEEMVSYRFVDRFISPITNDIEIMAVEDAINNSEESIKIYLRGAIDKLSKRDNPDYEGSIHESVGAVEYMCNKLSGDEKGTLGKSLDLLENSGVHIHPALKEAFKKIYGYTSDEPGIRHGKVGERKATYAEAAFMVVSCSAFINYLKTVTAE